jgi:hypothetical protein
VDRIANAFSVEGVAIMSNTGGDAVRRMRINDIQRDVDNIRLALDALRKVDV